jgi:hypothetical protein
VAMGSSDRTGSFSSRTAEDFYASVSCLVKHMELQFQRLHVHRYSHATAAVTKDLNNTSKS